MLNTDVFLGSDHNRCIVVINRLGVTWNILCDNVEKEIAMYRDLLQHIEDNENFNEFQGRDSFTGIEYDSVEHELKFVSYTVVCGRDMKSTLRFKKDEGTNLVNQIIELLTKIDA